jgi:putative lipoprotein
MAGRYLLILCLTAAGCATQAPTRITGTANYLERVALPAGAAFEATLEDVSKADASSEQIGSTRIEHPGNPPFSFSIPYDPARIDQKHRYAVRARILLDGKLLFTTDQHYPVLTAGEGSVVALQLRRVAASAQASDEPLENTYWKLAELGGGPVAAASGQQEAHFILHRADKRVSGSGGCNRFTGGYELQGERLTFKQMAGTMMACANGMDTEKAFLSALGKSAQARIKQQQLELLDVSGSVLARFQAVHLR